MTTIRTTTLGSSTSMLNYMKTGESRYNKLAEEAASGSKLTQPSDNPTAAKSVLNINTKLDQLSSYSNNMATAQNELNVLDDTFTSITDSIQAANDLATQAANGTYTQKDLDNLKTQIDQIMNNVADLGNTQFNGNYLFSGTSTSTPAYSIATDALGNITGVTYNGTPSTDEYQRSVQISDGVNVGINTTGDQLLGSYSAGPPATGSGLLLTLGNLSTALASGDKTTISSSLNSLDSDLDTVLANQTKFASVSQRFAMTENSNETMTTQLKGARSNLQDADLAEVLTNLTAQQTALQATMSVTAQMMKGASLLDYIR